MENPRQEQSSASQLSEKILVWDIPTRLFHWLLVVFVTISFVTGHIGGNAMQIHEWSGFVILSLLLFRLMWGFWGSRQSRFVTFVRGPAAVLRYAKALARSEKLRYLGHNPLGGWSILAMLITLLTQAVTGLFATDDIFTQGPLYPLVSDATSHLLTRIHRLNQNIILVLIVIHLLAIVFYLFVKRDNLIKPMIVGTKEWYEGAQPSTANHLMAAAIAGLAALAVYLLVGYGTRFY
jgi:cytochrome b